MIHLLMTCLWMEAAMGSPIFRDGTYTPTVVGSRPLCANKSVTFCEEVDKYPTQLITKLLREQLFPIDDLFTDDSEGLDDPQEFLFLDDVIVPEKTSKLSRKLRSARRIAGYLPSDLHRDCLPKKVTVEPKMAINKYGEWKFILQDDDAKAKQNISVQLCSGSNECGKKCHQFYSPVPLISLDSTGLPSKDKFWMPSSCHCITEHSRTA